MPEKFRANESQRGVFWFWKKTPLQNKHRRNADVPAKDIIAQANDVVNKCITGKASECSGGEGHSCQKLQAFLFLGVTASVLGVLIYYLIK